MFIQKIVMLRDVYEEANAMIFRLFGGFLGGMTSNLDIYLQKGYITVVLSNHNHSLKPNVGTKAVLIKIRELLALVDDAPVDAK